jgi:uncharacterized membrane protein
MINGATEEVVGMGKFGIWEIAIILVVVLIILGILTIFVWIRMRNSRKKKNSDI